MECRLLSSCYLLRLRYEKQREGANPLKIAHQVPYLHSIVLLWGGGEANTWKFAPEWTKSQQEGKKEKNEKELNHVAKNIPQQVSGEGETPPANFKY